MSVLRKTNLVQHVKQGSTHHNMNVMTTSRPLEFLHMDLFGPVAYLGIGGSKYGLVFVIPKFVNHVIREYFLYLYV
jgi:hypothetical protein